MPTSPSTTILLGVISSVLSVILIGIYRAKIIAKIKRTGHYLFDTKANIYLKRIDKYDTSPEHTIDHSLFKEIQEKIGDVSLEGFEDNQLCINVDDMSADIRILLEADPSTSLHVPASDHESASERYKVLIQTDPNMNFGYRTYNDLDRFRVISNKISDIVSEYCFEGTRSKDSFVTGKLDTRVPVKEKEIDDERLGLKAHFEDSKMIFNLREPENITKGVRTYFHPLNFGDS